MKPTVLFVQPTKPQMTCLGLQTLLEQQNRHTVDFVGAVRAPSDVRQLAQKTQPAVIVVATDQEQERAELTSLDTVDAVHAASPRSHLVLIGPPLSYETHLRLLNLGVDGLSRVGRCVANHAPANPRNGPGWRAGGQSPRRTGAGRRAAARAGPGLARRPHAQGTGRA